MCSAPNSFGMTFSVDSAARLSHEPKTETLQERNPQDTLKENLHESVFREVFVERCAHAADNMWRIIRYHVPSCTTSDGFHHGGFTAV